MTVTKWPSLGTTFTFDAVACVNVTEISVDGLSNNEKKLSCITDSWNLYAGTSGEPGSIKVKAFYDITSYATLTAFLGAPTTEAWTITYQTSESVTGNGFLKSLQLTGLTQDDYVQVELEIKNSGEVTFTHAS